MKRFVNGVEVELAHDAGEVVSGSDRLFVKTSVGTSSAVAVRRGDAVLVSYRGRQYRVERSRPAGRSGSDGAESGEIFAPMPGQVVDVLVEAGQTVTHRQKLLVLEAMKTQQAFVAPFDGTIGFLEAEVGQQVQEGQKLVEVVPEMTDEG